MYKNRTWLCESEGGIAGKGLKRLYTVFEMPGANVAAGMAKPCHLCGQLFLNRNDLKT